MVDQIYVIEALSLARITDVVTMPFWKNLGGKKTELEKPIMSKEEWSQFTLQLVQLFQKKEQTGISNDSETLRLIDENLQRFNPDTVRLCLEEAKHVKSPAGAIIEASPVAEAISGKTRIAYSGGDDLKERLLNLVIADHNLYCYSELHRQAGDILFTSGNYPKALDHYSEVLRCRPRYSYALRDPRRDVETPPELQGYQWPQIEDRNSHRMYNIRVTPLSLVEGQMLTFFYAKLGRCLSRCGKEKNLSEQAFRISHWFLDNLGPNAGSKIIVTFHHERAEFLVETGSFNEAIAEYEQIVSLLSQPNESETALAWNLICLGEAYLKAGRTQSASERLQKALTIAKRLNRQDLITKAEALLNDKQA